MPLDYASSPWLEGWKHYHQLWTGDRLPGNELDLSLPNGRGLTVQFRNDRTRQVDFAINESGGSVAIAHAKRGVISFVLEGEAWQQALNFDDEYTCEIVAYMFLYASFPFPLAAPEPHMELLNGIEVYGSPRQVLEVLGNIPGADVQVTVDLTDGWTQDDRGYWTKDIPENLQTFGLWVNDYQVQQVDYGQLALKKRAFARLIPTGQADPANPVHRLYVNEIVNLGDRTKPLHVETAYSRYVLRCLEEATAEIERKTGTFFSQKRVVRELHRGLSHHRQIALRHKPMQIDSGFRLDLYTRGRVLFRRLLSSDVSNSGFSDRERQNCTSLVVCDRELSILSVSQNLWDWFDSGVFPDDGWFGTSSIPPGEFNIEATYVAGYEKLPHDVDEAGANLAAIRQATYWQQSISMGLSGLSIGCVNLNFGQLFQSYAPGWQQSADAIIDQYKTITIDLM